MIRRVAPALFAALLATACSVGDDYQRPPIDTPKNWNGSINQAEAWPDTYWWQRFNVPALNTLIKQAQTNNDDIQAAVARIQQADAQLRIAGASLLPTIDANGATTRSQQAILQNRVVTVNNNTASNRRLTINNFNSGLSASYELDFWGKNRAARDSAEALLNASRYDKETVALSTLASVANTYFDLLTTYERLGLANQNLANAENLQASFKRRFDAGLVSALDVAQQDNLVASQRASIPPLQLRFEQNKNALAILVGQLPENFGTGNLDAGLATVRVPAVTAGLPSELLQRRPDVQNAEAQLISANADITQARAAFFPSIALTAEGGYQSNLLSQLAESNGRFWSLGTNVLQPIFRGGALRGQLDYNKARYEELARNYHKTMLTAFSDVENALAGTTLNGDQEQAQLEAMQAAQKAYQLTLNQWHAGTIDITTVLNTQQSMFAAQDNYAQVKLAQLQALVNLYTALGGGWQQPSKPE